MPVHDNPHDREAEALHRAAQEDPWVMYLVVRRERLVPVGALCAAVVRASVGVVERYAADPRFAEAFELWSSRSFRKVCLRANEKDWPRLDELPNAGDLPGDQAVVRALPPRLKSAREPLLVKLQAFTTELSALPPSTAQPGVHGDPLDPVMPFVVAREVSMSGGKLSAQVSHAVLMSLGAHGASHEEAFQRWARAGMRCAFVTADRGAWSALRAEEICVVVRDAGLTEVASGTETVMALPPAPSGAWSPRLRALPSL